MKKILTLALSIAFIGVFGQAKISDLPATTTLTGVELFPVVQGGVTKKTTAAQIASLSAASATNSWYNGGNTVGTNTAYIGTNDNRSLLFKTNNALVGKWDSLGLLNIGTPVYTNTSNLVSLRVKKGNSFIDFGERSNLNPCLWFSNTNSPNNNTSSNWAISGGTISTVINGPLTSIDLRVQAANVMVIRGTATSGAVIPYELTGPSTTSQTASTEIPVLKITPGGRQWLSGNITTQRQYYFRAEELTATATSSIANVYGVYGEPPTASTNMSFGNSWGLGTNSNAHVTGSLVVGQAAKTPVATLDLAGTMSVSSTASVASLKTYSSAATSSLISLILENGNTSGYGSSLYFRGTNGTTYDYAALQSENNSTGGTLRFLSSNTSASLIIAGSINSSQYWGIGNITPFSQMHIGKSAADATTAPTTFSNSYYLGLGRAEYTVGSYRSIGLGYCPVNTNSFPTAISYQEKSNSGKSKGDLFFATRDVTTDTDPTQRMRIFASGEIAIGTKTTAPTHTLDVTGGAAISTTLQLGNNTSTLTGGNSGTIAVLSDALFNFNLISTVGAMADATTYYFGGAPIGLQTSSVAPILIPYNCTLIGYCANFVVNGGSASAENATLSINVNGTPTALNSSIKMNDGTGINTYTSSSLSQVLNAGSFINAQLLTPSWGTNPVSTVTSIIFYFVRKQ